MAERRDVTRAKAAIQKAYYELLYLKPKDKITVKDVLARSNFSHGTFYAHFQNIEDLEHRLEESILEECHRTLQRTKRVQAEPCLQAFESHRTELRAFANRHSEADIVRKLKALINTALLRSMESENRSAVQPVCNCISGALVDACVAWVLDDGGLSREDFLKIITTFLSGGIQGLIDGHDATMQRLTF